VQATDTKERLLDAAERLFGQRGFAETSVRSITAEAGANLGAINYHFGSKEALLRAVFSRRLQPLNRRRIELLERCEQAADGEPVALEEVLRAFMEPVLRLNPRLGGEGALFARLLGRAITEPNELVTAVMREEFSELLLRFLPAIGAALPEVPHEDLFWKVHFLIGTMGYVMADTYHLEMISGGACCEPDQDEVLRHLVPFVAAGLRAAVPARVTEGRR
jgi:AcrR family transcriptional regulator